MKFLIPVSIVQAALYCVIAWLSSRFADGTNLSDRPLLLILALFAISFLLYLSAIRTAIRCPRTTHLGWIVIVPAILFRCILLPSQPIQEIDIYRYLWDGAAAARGLSPYRYSPAQVLSVDADGVGSDDLQRLVGVRDGAPAMSEVLRRIHYAELPTIYPPVSQAVFAVGNWLTPQKASIDARVIILKAVLLAFDIGTIVLVWQLLKTAGRHPGWVVAYAWCPLVLKEFANSGHLDSIAVFLTTGAVWCTARQFDGRPQARASLLLSGALLLGLAVGAKLYAIVLLPLLVVAVAMKCRPAAAVAFAAATIAASAICLAPMLLSSPAPSTDAAETSRGAALPLPGRPDSSHAVKPTSGLKAFLSRWEMNDFLFMLTVENLRPAASSPQAPGAWFAIVPDGWRQAWINPVARRLAIDPKTAGFLVARGITLCVFGVIAIGLAWKSARRGDVNTLLEAAFLTLAWFWLLSPTQNPWYWTWALPLAPLARGRAWLAVSGIVFLYYVRFWLVYHFPDGPILGTAYDGARFFDFVVTWIEYLPWFAWLAAAAIARPRHSRQGTVTGHPTNVVDFTEADCGVR